MIILRFHSRLFSHWVEPHIGFDKTFITKKFICFWTIKLFKNSDTSNIIQLIKQVIINEIEGAEFYKLAAEKEGISEEVKNEFLYLSKEEMKHIEWLKILFDKIKNDKEDEF